MLRTSWSTPIVLRRSASSASTSRVTTSTTLNRRGARGWAAPGAGVLSSGSLKWGTAPDPLRWTRSSGTMFAPVPLVSVSSTQTFPTYSRLAGRGGATRRRAWAEVPYLAALRRKLDHIDGERHAHQRRLVGAHQFAPKHHEGRRAQQRGDGQLEQAAHEHGGGRKAHVDVVEGEDADQGPLGAADPAGDRNQVAELAEQVAEHERPEGGDGPQSGEGESEGRDVERHVRERPHDHTDAMGAQQGHGK